MNRIYMKTEICCGCDALKRLSSIPAEHVMIITDAFMVQSGTVDIIKKYLTGCPVSVFDRVVPDPPLSVITEGVKALAAKEADVVIALGGGSSLDAAKAIKEVATRAGMSKVKTCVAIPTTSGTGSEVTRFAVITDPVKKIKYPMALESMLPDIAILDPELTTTVPASVTADTGMDVITHCLESYVSKEANDFSDALAEKALQLVFRWLKQACTCGDDLLAREKLHNASCLAGMSFEAAGLGLNHGIAHSIGSKLHIPHGKINAMLLPLVLDYNSGLDDPDAHLYVETAQKYQRIARLLGLPAINTYIGAKNLVHAVRELNRDIKIPTTLRDLGKTPEQVRSLEAEIVKDAMNDVCTASNPRTPTAQGVSKILKQLIG